MVYQDHDRTERGSAKDRWELWMITKSWNMRHHQVFTLLESFGFEIHPAENGSRFDPKAWISKMDFREFMLSLEVVN